MYQRRFWERKGLEKRRNPQHPVIAQYAVPKINLIKKHIHIDKSVSVLDVGCGNGFFSFYFEKICNVVGLDYSQKMLSMNPIKRKILSNAGNLCFKNDSFDIVFCHALLHHVDAIEKVIQEMKRVTRQCVVIIEPNRKNLFIFFFSLLVKQERNALKFSLSYLRKVTENAGLKTIDCFSYGTTTPNKTPRSLLPLLAKFDIKFSLGVCNILIARKER